MKNYVFLLCVCFSVITICFSQSCSTYQDWFNSRKQRFNQNWCQCNGNVSKSESEFLFMDDEEEYLDDPDERTRIHDICEIEYPIVPDFSRPGQRISVTKCYEYIWEIQSRMDVKRQHLLCNIIGSRRSNRYKRDLSDFLKKIFLIMGGYNVESQKDFPHMGAIGWLSSDPFKYWKFMCGSSLISSGFALTAAHCISADPRDPTIADIYPKIVRFGEVDLFISGRKAAGDRNIKRMIPHPRYASPLKYFDIALIELDKPFIFTDTIQPACLWTEELDDITNVTITGWGVTDPRSREGHPYLQAASLSLIDSQYCDSLLRRYYNRRWCGIEDNQFCAGQMAGGIDACQGDSGGPLQIKVPLPQHVEKESKMYYIIGVTSFGIGCGKVEVPGIYSEVSKFLDWIEPIVWGY